MSVGSYTLYIDELSNAQSRPAPLQFLELFGLWYGICFLSFPGVIPQQQERPPKQLHFAPMWTKNERFFLLFGHWE